MQRRSRRNRRKLEAAERQWLKSQPDWVREANEVAAEHGLVGAVSMKKRTKLGRKNSK